MQDTDNEFLWWQRGIVYQIYPRSFQDSDGDGTGDLPGIVRRLEYLVWLGVDAIWLSPIFPSPMADFGYDVADFTSVDPIFGSLDDLDRLVAAAHAHDLRVLLDFVPNHTSDQHPWFRDARSSRQSPKRDWYIWRDGRPGGQPPNNWLSAFGGSAWEFDPPTGQYYLHTYLTQQPDLNWRNPAVRAAMLEVLRFWFERGIDGFRIDALRQVVKDPELRDNPPNPDWQPGDSPYERLLPLYSADQPELLDIIREWRDLSDRYPARVLVGELWLPIERLMAYYGQDGRGLHLPFNFHLILTAWQAPEIAALIQRYEAALPAGAWPNWVLGNHDRSRVATRVGAAQARVAAMLLLTLRGTPTLYQGDELGQPDVPIPPEAIQDPVERNLPGLGLGRDPERTPMLWDASANAGFTTGRPWLPLGADAARLNVATEQADPRSMLSLYRQLIGLRRRTPALNVGSYQQLHVDDALLVYARAHADQRLVVALNLSHAPRPLPRALDGELVLSTDPDRRPGTISALGADEGLIVRYG